MVISSGRWSAAGSWRPEACKLWRGRAFGLPFKGSFMNGLRDFKYDLHQLIFFRCYSELVMIRSKLPFSGLVDRRMIFLFSTMFLNSGIMSGSMSRCSFRSRSHVDVRVWCSCYSSLECCFGSVHWQHDVALHKVMIIDRLWLSTIC